jgi:hypothetical protein
MREIAEINQYQRKEDENALKKYLFRPKNGCDPGGPESP